MIDSRHAGVFRGTTSSDPPRPCARMETASRMSTWTESAEEAGESKPRSEATSGGQSGMLMAWWSSTLIWSPSSTATLRNLPDSSLRRCLMTSSPGAMTSSTKHNLGSVPVAPQT